MTKLHSTLKSCGLIGVQIAQKDIEYVVSLATDVLKHAKPFTVELQGVGNFPSLVYIPVVSLDRKLLKLHNELNNKIPFSEYPDFEGKGYLAHSTIIEEMNPNSKIFNALEQYKKRYFGRMIVRDIKIILGGEASPGDTFKVLKTYHLTE